MKVRKQAATPRWPETPEQVEIHTAMLLTSVRLQDGRDWSVKLDEDAKLLARLALLLSSRSQANAMMLLGNARHFVVAVGREMVSPDSQPEPEAGGTSLRS